MAYLEAEFAAAKAAPLSLKKARLVALLIDAYADRLFAATTEEAGDILVFREGLSAASPALGMILALAADRPGGPRLVVEAVEVPLADYPTLDIADFMVSIYNDHTVQRVRIALPDGVRLPAHVMLEEAIAALKQRSG